MANGPATSSWHPALMPDVDDGLTDFGGAGAPVTTSADAFSHHPDQEAASHETIHDDEHGGVDAWLAEDGDDADAWLAGDNTDAQEPVPHQSPAQDDEIPHPAPYESAVESAVETETGAKPPVPQNVSQHASSMSFARTVSHEVPFNDDDEGDWTLPRTNTDPFKFMSPSDRTNSFPAVPLMADSPGRSDDSPLPPNQALDVLEETERDYSMEEQEYQSGAYEDQEGASFEKEATWPKHAPSRSIGGDIEEPAAEAFEARYEEGVPLIPNSDPEEGSKLSAEPFGEDEDDDFFSQTHSSTQQPQTVEPHIPTLERKSTMQAMGALNMGSLSRQDTLDEAIEEEDGVKTEDDQNQAPAKEDLTAKWQEAFTGSDDEDDFLLDDATNENENPEIDPSAFLGSDDEGFLDDGDGFLDDDVEDPVPEAPPVAAHAQSRQSSGGNPYLPQAAGLQQPSSYAPANVGPNQQVPAMPYNAAPYGQAPPPRAEPVRAQSFADKSKGGYASPYDLPTDLVSNKVKPRQRASMQQLGQTENPAQAPAPPRSASMFAQGPPTTSAPPAMPGVQGGPPRLQPKASAPALRSSDNFFEDLPMSKPRPSSRHGNRAASPSPYTPAGQPHGPSPLNGPPTSYVSPAGVAPSSADQQPPAVSNLVAPERVSPYAALPSAAPNAQPPTANASRYSPAPAAQQSTANGGVPLAAANRYSPAPAAVRSSSYTPSTPSTSQVSLPHLPRTSSPLAHYEINSEKHGAGHGPNGEFDRRASSSYEPRLSRLSSLPPTREVEEEDDGTPGSRSLSATYIQSPPSSTAATRYSSVPPGGSGRGSSSPPPGRSRPSPQKRSGSGYVPQVSPATQPGFVPPPRAQTQSPGATRGGRPPLRTADSAQRPSSSYAPTSPTLTKSNLSAYPLQPRARGLSLTTNAVPPTDGREHDPLERWKGVPIMAWGLGGTLVTTFPKSIPRYSMGQTTPSILRSCGEVKVTNIKDVDPLEERLTKFPGPLKGKSKKKETLAWLTTGIETLEKELPDISFHSQLSLEAKRAVERLLLWKILRVFVEFDGVLEGSAPVEKAVRDILSPDAITPTSTNDALFTAQSGVNTGPVTSMQADGVDGTTMEQIRRDLLQGSRETAVWSAVDKRLWGHAMLIAHTVSPDLYKQVAQEFVRKEVNFPGHANESMAALYKVLSGNHEECVDELVPVHARAGLQLMSTESTSNPTRDAIDGLDKWRETLTLVLSNRSFDDVRGLNALGKLLGSYGRAEAAHICFLFGRQASVFGGIDDPNADFVLLGSDHRQQPDQFGKETEALQLSEVYEYGLSLSGVPAVAGGVPHLAAYKLQHALTLGEYGFRDQALQYCDAISLAITSQTKRSPYYNPLLEMAVDDLMTRLKQAPKGESSSWMSKPSMNKVSDSMWNRFNKFVAGDENDNKANGDENGPFARISTTPTISRSPSVSNFESYGVSPGYPGSVAPPAAPASQSKYAPVTGQAAPSLNPYDPASQYAPASASRQSSNDYTPGPYESAYPGGGASTVQNGGYAPPTATVPSSSGYLPDSTSSNSLAVPGQQPIPSGYQPYGLQESPTIQSQFGINEPGSAPSSYGYEPPTFGYEHPQTDASDAGDGGVGVGPEEPDTGAGGYEPPSFQPYGYEPPSYEPDQEPSTEDGDDAPKPKKKSFMDDDDDDIPSLKPQEKSKSDKDRENDEMFRKAAEEDAKRAAAQASQKKGWGLSGWFGGGKKAEPGTMGDQSPNKPVRAKLGEASSFVYDPELKRWINKKPGAENVEAKSATPPPPRAGPRSVSSGTPPPPSGTPPPPSSGFSAPPRTLLPPGQRLSQAVSMENLSSAPPMARSASSVSATVGRPPSAPPTRPSTSMSNASSIDDLIGAAAPRKPGQKKPRKAGRYVDVMAK